MTEDAIQIAKKLAETVLEGNPSGSVAGVTFLMLNKVNGNQNSLKEISDVVGVRLPTIKRNYAKKVQEYEDLLIPSRYVT